jgi:exosortase F-associated protein
MLKKILLNKVRFFIFLLLVLVLASIRSYETSLFYDPFLDFFKREYANLPIPKFDSLDLFWSLLFRYSLNTLVSLTIIFTVFNQFELVKFSAILYFIFFIILISAFFIILCFYGQDNNFLLFYVRRFLIQPLFVVLFIPAFYYQKQNN